VDVDVTKTRQLQRLPLAQGLSNYLGVSGHRRVTGNMQNTGIFFGNSYIKMSDITDGTSNTAMIGERDTQYCHSGTWVGTQNTLDLTSLDVSMVTGYDQPRLNAPFDAVPVHSALGCGEGFSSLHVGGAQFAFADGSVRYITNGVGYRYVNNGGGIACTATSGQYANDHRNSFNGDYQRMMSRGDKLPSGDLP
jgi:prepilin-type processing-associated H-X9-DG protein